MTIIIEKTQKIIATITFLMCAFYQQVVAQDFKTQFFSLANKNDTLGQQQLLKQWEKANHNDPELYVAYYNYYVKKASISTLSLSTVQKGEKSVQFTDPQTGKVAGYINEGETGYNPSVMKTGFSYIDTAIIKFPDRLDIRFGKIYMLGKLKNYDAFTTEIIKTVDYGSTISFKWKWANGKLLEKPQEYMLSALQDYFGQLFAAGDDQVNNMRTIAANNLKYFPENVENLSNLAITYMLTKDYDTALMSLLKAEKLAPQDGIVLNNIAFCYYNKKDKPNAIKYYELGIKYDDDKSKKFAEEKLKELKGN